MFGCHNIVLNLENKRIGQVGDHGLLISSQAKHDSSIRKASWTHCVLMFL